MTVPTIERRALILADEPERVERFVAPLRRANLTVLRAEHVWDAEREIRHTPLDLIVVALPVLGADRLVQRLREEDCVSRRAGLIVIGRADEIEPHDLTIGRHANRLLPGACSPVEFQQEVTALLDVAPRIPVSDGVRLQLTLPSGGQLELWLENLSTSGMLMRTLDTLAVGTVFGFALEIESLPEPIRGRAKVVRQAAPNPIGHFGLGAQFLALGGEAPQRLDQLVRRTLAEHAPSAPSEAAPGEAFARGPSAQLERAASSPIVDAREVERCREELADLTPLLDEMLERGLARRLVVADWYITGAELGLESLRAFSAILSSIYENRSISAVAERRLADLVEVRGQLLEFGRPHQDVETRVRIMLELRPALHRLLREVDEDDDSTETRSRYPGAVSQAVVEIQRLAGARRSLENLVALLDELRRPRLPLLSSGPRRNARQIAQEYGALARSLGVPLAADQLRGRRGLQTTLRAVDGEKRNLERRLQNIHRKAYSMKLRSRASDDLEADLQEPKLRQVLVDTLAAGADYLARSYAVYRHALEVIGAEPTLIDRIERLADTVLAADRAAETGTIEAAPIGAPVPH